MVIQITDGDIITVEDRKKGTSSRYLISIESGYAGREVVIGTNIVNRNAVEFSFLRNAVQPSKEVKYEEPYDDESPTYITGTEDGI